MEYGLFGLGGIFQQPQKLEGIDVDKEKSPLVKKVFEMYATENIPKSSANWCEKEPFNECWKQNLFEQCSAYITKSFLHRVDEIQREILRNTRVVNFKETFDRCQKLCRNGKSETRQKTQFPFSWPYEMRLVRLLHYCPICKRKWRYLHLLSLHEKTRRVPRKVS